MRAFHRGYSSQRVTRLHIERPEQAVKHPHRATFVERHVRPEGWCGTSASDHTNSPVIWLDEVPRVPPDGLKWCPLCVGRAAEWLGTLDSFAKLLSGVERRRAEG